MKKIIFLISVFSLLLTACFAVDGITDDSIRVGMCNALTGPTSALGQGIMTGASVYFDNINNAGGINGRKIVLISKDDGYEPANTVPNTNELIDKENVFVLFGYVGTPTSKAAVPIATVAGVPFIAPFTGAEAFRNPVNKYVFNVRASYYDETEVMVNYLVNNGYKKIGFFGQNDSYGDAGKAGVMKALKKRKMQLFGDARYARNTVEVDDALTQLRVENPDAVIMVGAYKPCAAFIKKAKAAGMNWAFVNISFVGTKELLAELGSDKENVMITEVVPVPYETDSIPLVQSYRAAMTAAGQQDKINFTSFEGYIDAMVLVEGLKKAGKDMDRDSFIAAMESISDLDIGGLKIGFSPTNHQALDYVILTKVIDGKLQQIK
ncbi:MAG: ABC transporter substrate-binding protein [Candidatus Margulisbacteria bacterium]|nr:ABC transporter substrate-binding protein [Candidatus Margulisiibacteriota bacterium]